ncbi:hypothetical protein [Pannonibacter tanglangensis]|uniref:YkgJ family cysteine cluster protein n=1 Tax=Pannonibacter tanglangensis TaxID=2750084 RepID=A0ABW9ZNP8_9HYPH|nr:hypothetical protein [Pannonibacter sp. XCT-34]NBN65994.1 hypothetical protein [Pannonibacter sp. XCT-34]
MGQAKRKKEAGSRVSWCRTCTYCCDLPEIGPLDKPMYRPCHHIKDGGCGIFGAPERPAACLAYHCAYLSARVTNAPDRNRIPHPLDAGAYFHRDPIERVYVLFVDPARPQTWKASDIVPYLRERIGQGFEVLIFDRGRRMVVTSLPLFEAILARDIVAFADSEGRPHDIESWAQAAPRYSRQVD